MTSKKKRRGFTLIELLVVIAILATIAGGILVSYDGLETDAAQGQATYNISAIDKAVRTYRTLNKEYPNELDSLLFSATGDGTDGTGLNTLNAKLMGKIGPHPLNAQGAAALAAVGINRTRYVSGALGYDNAALTAGGTSLQIPNRAFDNPTRGRGVVVPLTAGAVVAAIESPGIGSFATGAPPANSARLRDIAGLDENRRHVVVAFGLGNNSTMVAERANDGVFGRTGLLSEAPFYTHVTKAEYGRYLLLFHLATDTDGNGTIEPAEYRAEARFIACLDTRGDWLDEEYAEYTNQKP
ncbi:MAG: type II secretion system GspH family protein [Planctomycetes bacterium]|nr:type II secretion system GspH family protein [Planctomycetota bacterium]